MNTRTRTCAVILDRIESQTEKRGTGVAQARVRHAKNERLRTITVVGLLALAATYEVTGSLFVTAVVGITTAVLVHGLTDHSRSG